MKVIYSSLVLVFLMLCSCAYKTQTTPVKETKNQEVVVILTPYLSQYDYEIKDTIEVELTASYNTFWRDYGISHNPNLTITEEILTKLIKKAQSVGANAITNFDYGSYDILAHQEQEEMTGIKSAVYGHAIAIKVHNAEWEVK